MMTAIYHVTFVMTFFCMYLRSALVGYFFASLDIDVQGFTYWELSRDVLQASGMARDDL